MTPRDLSALVAFGWFCAIVGAAALVLLLTSCAHPPSKAACDAARKECGAAADDLCVLIEAHRSVTLRDGVCT